MPDFWQFSVIYSRMCQIYVPSRARFPSLMPRSSESLAANHSHWILNLKARIVLKALKSQDRPTQVNVTFRCWNLGISFSWWFIKTAADWKLPNSIYISLCQSGQPVFWQTGTVTVFARDWAERHWFSRICGCIFKPGWSCIPEARHGPWLFVLHWRLGRIRYMTMLGDCSIEFF